MIYGSACSGIEAATVAWEEMGWKPAWFSEVEAFPSAVLAHHWPTVDNLGDMTLIPGLLRSGAILAPDVFVAGTPCQAFSVSGMRKGLSDERGQLTIKYVEVVNEIDNQRAEGAECIAVWENVPGVLSDKENAFGCFLGALVGEGDKLEPPGKRWSNSGIVYGPQRIAAWRVLDAQYFGVAQRRKRVFVVASAREGFDPGQVLFEFEGMRRYSPPSREKGEGFAADVAPSLKAGGPGVSRPGDSRGQDPVVAVPHSSTGAGYWQEGFGTLRVREQDSHENIVVMAHGQTNAEVREDGKSPALTCNHEAPIVATLDSNYGKLQGCSGQDLNHGHSHLVVHGTQDPCTSDKAFALGRNSGQENGAAAGSIAYQEEQSPTLKSASSGTNQVPVVAFMENQRAEVRVSEQTDALTKGGGKPGQGYPAALDGMQVRRLTPVECERLQDFPDGHTMIQWRGKPAENCPDGPRYKAIGNSMAVPCMRWIGERIQKIEEILKSGVL